MACILEPAYLLNLYLPQTSAELLIQLVYHTVICAKMMVWKIIYRKFSHRGDSVSLKGVWKSALFPGGSQMIWEVSHSHVCEICGMRQIFKGDLIKFCEFFTKVTLELP